MSIDISSLIVYAKGFQDLGWAVQRQLESLLDGEGDLNANAVELIRKWRESLYSDVDADELDEALAAWDRSKGGEA